MHPLKAELLRLGLTVADLVQELAKRGHHTTASYVSQRIIGYRRFSVDAAEQVTLAISSLGGKINPADLVFWRPAPKKSAA